MTKTSKKPTTRKARKPFSLKKEQTVPVKYTPESVRFLTGINNQFRKDHTYWRVNIYGDIREVISEGNIKLEYLRGTIKEIEQAVQKMENYLEGQSK